eukprot:365608-Chlamydomonas_euryale.AAC.16
MSVVCYARRSMGALSSPCRTWRRPSGMAAPDSKFVRLDRLTRHPWSSGHSSQSVGFHYVSHGIFRSPPVSFYMRCGLCGAVRTLNSDVLAVAARSNIDQGFSKHTVFLYFSVYPGPSGRPSAS